MSTTTAIAALEPRKAGVFLKDAGGLPPIRKEAQNFYEGATWKWGEQGFIFGGLQDMRLDANAMTRKELMRKSRAFERNNAFQQRIADLFEQYTVGAGGLAVVSQSKDANIYFKQWAMDCDALGLMDFGTLQSVSARNWFIDGECFIVKVISRGKLKLQVIEGHRVETPGHLSGEEGVSVVDGVAIDAAGRKTGIWVNTTQVNTYSAPNAQAWKFVPCEDVFHLYEPSRPGMYRGLPFCHAVMNDINDLDDLQKLVNQVAKQAATIGNVTTNRLGELPTRSARQVGMKIPSTTATGAVVAKQAADFYQVKFGASEIALQHGDSIKQFQADRPSLAEREHWDYLTGKICIGQGVAKQLVWPYSIQGTALRSDLETCAAFFRCRSAVVQCMVKWVFYNVIKWAQDYDRSVLRGGFDFTGYENCIVRAPRSPNVDMGRNSRAAIGELNGNARTYQDWYAEAGQDWTEQFAQIAKERELMKSLNITPLDLQPSKGNADEAEPDEDTAAA